VTQKLTAFQSSSSQIGGRPTQKAKEQQANQEEQYEERRKKVALCSFELACWCCFARGKRRIDRHIEHHFGTYLRRLQKRGRSSIIQTSMETDDCYFSRQLFATGV